MAKLIPDISHHHPVGSWGKVAASVDVLISKATEGTSFVDSTLKTFVRECESRNIPYWLYVYLRKGNETKQTEFMVDTCKPLVGKNFVGYILDIEEGNSASNIMAALSWLLTHTETKAMIYTMYAQYAAYKAVIASRSDRVAWWEARYGRNNGEYLSAYPCHQGVDLHQFTSNGICPGIADKIDLSRIAGKKPLEWFMGRASEPEPKGFSGKFPSLPSHGYFTLGDGYKQNLGCQMDIKNLQTLVNWINGGNIQVDGKYGPNTAAAVKLAQTELKVVVDGLFGRKTLLAAKAYRK